MYLFKNNVQKLKKYQSTRNVMARILNRPSLASSGKRFSVSSSASLSSSNLCTGELLLDLLMTIFEHNLSELAAPDPDEGHCFLADEPDASCD